MQERKRFENQLLKRPLAPHTQGDCSESNVGVIMAEMEEAIDALARDEDVEVYVGAMSLNSIVQIINGTEAKKCSEVAQGTGAAWSRCTVTCSRGASGARRLRSWRGTKTTPSPSPATSSARPSTRGRCSIRLAGGGGTNPSSTPSWAECSSWSRAG